MSSCWLFGYNPVWTTGLFIAVQPTAYLKEQIMMNMQTNAYFKNNSDLFTRLNDMVNSNPHGFFRQLDHENNADIRMWLKDQLPLLDDEKYSFSTKCNWIFNDIHDFPKCIECGHLFDRNVTVNKIYPKEIDIWIPEKKIGIECEGVYWHSVEFQQRYSRSIHNSIAEKTRMCEEKGIHLIHIFQDEWMTSQNEVKEVLAKLIRGDEFVPTADCEQVVLSHDRYPSFIEIPGFKLDSISGDDVVERYAYKRCKSGKITRMKKKYHVFSARQLIFKRDRSK